MLTRRHLIAAGASIIGGYALLHALPEDRSTPAPYRVSVAGRSVGYHRFGEGPPLLFLHGLNRPPGKYGLTALDRYEIIAPEVYGLIPDTPATLAGYAEITARFCEALRLEDAIAVGHSTGGAMPWYPRLRPHIRQAVSVNPILPSVLASSDLVTGGLALFLHELLGQSGTRGVRTALEDLRKTLLSGVPQREDRRLADDVARFRFPDDIAVPTVILYGTGDELFPLTPDVERAAHDAFRSVRIEKIDRIGDLPANHEWAMHYPQALARRVRQLDEPVRI